MLTTKYVNFSTTENVLSNTDSGVLTKLWHMDFVYIMYIVSIVLSVEDTAQTARLWFYVSMIQ